MATADRSGDHYATDICAVEMVRGDARQECVLKWAFRRDRDYELTVFAPDGAIHVLSSDLFRALQDVRRQLEPSGWRLAVQGSRRQAWASGMQRDMIGARLVYICELGREVQPREAVPLFGKADPEDLATVDEQLAFHDQWMESRRRWPRSGGNSGT